MLARVCVYRLARTVQKGTTNCPDKAKTMQLKLNKMDTPFKQVHNRRMFQRRRLFSDIEVMISSER